MKLPAFYGTRRFITAVTSARHLSLSRASSIQSTPPSHFLKIPLNIIRPFMPGSPTSSLSFQFLHQNTVYPSTLTCTRYMPRPSHSSRFYHPNKIGWGVQLRNMFRSRKAGCFVFSPTVQRSGYLCTGLFEMIVGVLTTCHTQYTGHLVLQIQPHVISFYGVTSRTRFMFLFFPQVSRNWRYESEPPLKPSPLTCYKQFGTNSIIVLMFVESQRVHI